MAEELFGCVDVDEDKSTKKLYSNLYSVKEFSQTYKIGINTVYRLCKLSDFPFIKIGCKIYIVADEFKNWVSKNCGKEV